jgi:hypothetical protein
MNARSALLPLAVAACFAACSSSSGTGSTESDAADSASGSSGGGASSSSSSGGSSGAGGSSGSGGSSGADASASDAGVTDAQVVYGDAGICGTCGVGHVCVEDIFQGGAQFLVDDAGQCPGGRIPSGGTPDVCITPPSYHCASLPSACATAAGSTAVAHCACAPELCPTAYQCADPTPTLMTCSLLAP